MSAKVESGLERCYFETEIQPEVDGSHSMARISVHLKANAPLSKVRLTLAVEEPLRLTQTSHMINSISNFNN